MTKPVLGILGGMGPRASAEFVRTVYEVNSAEVEQEMPSCVLLSDPGIADRTEAILKHGETRLLAQLESALDKLDRLGVSKIVVCCVTSHFLLPRLPARLTRKVISLVDLAVGELRDAEGQALLLCSQGTRQAAVFQAHPLWKDVALKVTLPSDDDQATVHGILYDLKTRCDGAAAYARLRPLLARYPAHSIVAGCTELHLVTRHLMTLQDEMQSLRVIDPLLTLARGWSLYVREGLAV